MNPSNKIMINLESFLRISVSNENQEMNVSSIRVINQSIRLLRSLNKHSVGILEISQMSKSRLFLSCQIQGLMTICIWASSVPAIVDFPRFISVPDGPGAFGDFEFLLEPFTEPPFGGFVDNCKLIMTLTENDVCQFENWLIVLSPDNLHDRACSWMGLYLYVTCRQKRVNLLLEFRNLLALSTVNGKTRLLSELKIIG